MHVVIACCCGGCHSNSPELGWPGVWRQCPSRHYRLEYKAPQQRGYQGYPAESIPQTQCLHNHVEHRQIISALIILVRAHIMLVRAHIMLVRAHIILVCAHIILVRAHIILVRAHIILVCGHIILYNVAKL